MKTITETIRAIETATADTDVRVVRRIEVGQVVQQGDLYLHRVADTHPRGEETRDRQLAVGTTQGARHVALGDLRVFRGTTPPPIAASMPLALCGPVVESPERWTLDHPEHPSHELPAGTYQVTYQMDERTRQRVLD